MPLGQPTACAPGSCIAADTKAKGTLFAPGDEAWFQVLDRLNLTAADLLAGERGGCAARRGVAASPLAL